MRLAFMILRLIGYAAVLSTIFKTERSPVTWVWVGLSSAWGIYDHLKRPDDSAYRLRLGTWIEAAVIVISTCYLHEAAFLFLLVSPVARTCVHLPIADSLSIGGTALALDWVITGVFHAPKWMPWAEAGSVLAAGSYSLVMGMLLNQRGRLRRALSISVFEQEQRVRDEERLRVATQLHDVMGQYWTAVIRALDVAEATDGEVHRTFLHKARDAAVDGLAEMRHSIQSWNQGRQSAEEWMAFLGNSVHRLRDLTGISITLVEDEIQWHRLPKPELSAEALARIVIESTTNAIRHGHADSVHIDISSNQSAITVEITDHGIGLQSAGERTTGTGIRSMEELAASVGGSLFLQGSGKQTRVHLCIAYSAEKGEIVVERG